MEDYMTRTLPTSKMRPPPGFKPTSNHNNTNLVTSNSVTSGPLQPHNQPPPYYTTYDNTSRPPFYYNNTSSRPRPQYYYQTLPSPVKFYRQPPITQQSYKVASTVICPQHHHHLHEQQRLQHQLQPQHVQPPTTSSTSSSSASSSTGSPSTITSSVTMRRPPTTSSRPSTTSTGSHIIELFFVSEYKWTYSIIKVSCLGTIGE